MKSENIGKTNTKISKIILGISGTFPHEKDEMLKKIAWLGASKMSDQKDSGLFKNLENV